MGLLPPHSIEAEQSTLGALMLDMYPKGALAEAEYHPGQDPTEVLQWFDSGNYMIQRQPRLENLGKMRFCPPRAQSAM